MHYFDRISKKPVLDDPLVATPTDHRIILITHDFKIIHLLN